MVPDAITSVNAKLVPFTAGTCVSEIGIWIGIMIREVCMTMKAS